MTPCASLLEELSAYLDGELSAEEERTLQRHLTTCTSCQEKVKVLAALEEAVTRSTETALVPQTLHASVSALSQSSPRSFRGSSRAVKIGLASALLLVVGGLASWWWQQNVTKSGYEEIAQALVADHIHYLQEPDVLEIASADPTAVAEWFHERVPFPVQIPHLHDGRLLGGRLCTLLGRKTALVLYERGGKRLSLFTLAAEALPVKEKEQTPMANADRPQCLQSFGKYDLCFLSSEKAVQAIVAEEPEMKDLAFSLLRSP